MKCPLLAWSLAVTVVATMGGAAVAAENVVEGDDARIAQAAAQRYGQQVDLKRYPQGNPQEAIRSIIKATTAGEIEYMVAHLISPRETDRKFRGDLAKFQRLAAKATPEKSAEMVKALRLHLKDGIWTIWRGNAWSYVDGTLGLSLENIGNRWFMHNTPKNMPGQEVAGMPAVVDSR